MAVSIAEGLNHEIPGAIFAVRGVRSSAVGAKLENACATHAFLYSPDRSGPSRREE